MFLLYVQFAREIGGELIVERKFFERDGIAARVVGAGFHAASGRDDAAKLVDFLGRARDHFAVRARAVHVSGDSDCYGETLDAAGGKHRVAGGLADFVFDVGYALVIFGVGHRRRGARCGVAFGGGVRRNAGRAGRIGGDGIIIFIVLGLAANDLTVRVEFFFGTRRSVVINFRRNADNRLAGAEDFFKHVLGFLAE